VYIGDTATADIINCNGQLMGMEDVLCHLQTRNEAALAFMRRRADFQLKLLERLLDKCKDYVDFVWFGEDLGTQHSPMISRELYLEIMKPIHQQFFDLAKAYGKPSIIHTCGSSSWVYEDFIEMGVAGVDTLQPEAANMSPEYLKARFGSRLCYRGCISTAGPLACCFSQVFPWSRYFTNGAGQAWSKAPLRKRVLGYIPFAVNQERSIFNEE
jgi:uroporphyrinogen decarboxylase